MSESPFNALSLDPNTLCTLHAAYKNVWGGLKTRFDLRDHDAARDAISAALVDMAKSGQLELSRLEAYATEQALSILDSAIFDGVGIA